MISAKYKRVSFHYEKVAHANLWVEMQTNFVSNSSWASSSIIETDVLDGFASCSIMSQICCFEEGERQEEFILTAVGHEPRGAKWGF